MITADFLEPEEASEYGAVYYHGDYSGEEEDGGLVEVGVITGVITGVTESTTKEVEKLQQALKSMSLLSYILKPHSLLTQIFKDNNKSQENIFKHMCGFGTWEEWRSGRIPASYYHGVDTRQYQYLNLNFLECITGYIMDDSVGDRYLKNLLQ